MQVNAQAAPKPRSVRFDAEDEDLLRLLSEKYPRISTSQMIKVAVHNWLIEAKDGIDANLRPLKRRSS